MKTSRLIDETGARYGSLMVLASGPAHRTTRKWICACDCGRRHMVAGQNLRSGDVKSCGHCGRAHLKGDEAAFRQAFSNYKKNAAVRGLRFELSADEFRTLAKQECRYCGAQPSNTHKPTRPRAGAECFVYNGIDRLDNNDGYVTANVVPCCSMCNAAKSKLSVSEFLLWVGRVARHSAHEINLNYKD